MDLNASEQINAVVDNLADKMGVATEAILPVTETMVSEVAVAGLVAGGILFFLGLLLIPFLYRNMSAFSVAKTEDARAGYGFVIAGCIIAMLVMFGLGCSWLHEGLTPTVTLVEKFL